jgi:hypothetical protein
MQGSFGDYLSSVAATGCSLLTSRLPLILLCQFRSDRYCSIRLVRTNSSVARNSSPAHTWQLIAASEQQRRSSAGGKTPMVAHVFGYAADAILPDLKAVAQHDQYRLATETLPQPALVLIPSQQILGILMKAFDRVPPYACARPSPPAA